MLIYPTFYLILYTSTYTSTYKGLYVINQLVQNGNKSMHMDSELKKIEQVFSGHMIILMAFNYIISFFVCAANNWHPLFNENATSPIFFFESDTIMHRYVKEYYNNLKDELHPNGLCFMKGQQRCCIAAHIPKKLI